MKLLQVNVIVICIIMFTGVIPCMGLDVSLEEGNGYEATSSKYLYAQSDASYDFKEEEEDYDFMEEELEQISDPLEPINRFFFEFNDRLYFWALKPVAQGYASIVPEDARVSISYFFNNIATPARLVNSSLQFKFNRAGDELKRFGINTTLGILGLFDVAKSKYEISASDEDLGQTLGDWGFYPGIYINWPFFGPSNLRDSIGMVGDSFLDPVNYVNPLLARYGIKTGDAINRTSLSIGDYEEIKKDALDPYDAVKDIYFQYRKSKVDR